MKSNLPFRLLFGLEQASERREKIDNRLVVRIEPALEFFQLYRQLRICRDHLAQPDECTNDSDTRLNRNVAVKHASQHDRAMLSECPRPKPATSAALF